ncbi:hypothetical protein [Paracholeplasma manati]|uniref:hypothetical protein n=1 Tax=Paracholeplasma manati TaxID=591373 RepID=UPI002407F0AD|nr:hypothetical protein [Paracholeplasma manati]MDG0889377.1 hypothetical protein [Paracholeplasma manati]
MTRENRILLINALSALLVGVIFLFAFSSLISNQEKQIKLSYYQEFFATANKFESVSVNQTSLTEKVKIMKDNTVLGYLYVGSGTSTQIPGHGGSEDELRLHVFVKANREIAKIVVDYYEHTSTYVEGSLKPDLVRLQGSVIENYLSVDLVGGASAYSMPIVHNILSAISRDLTGSNPIVPNPVDPYAEIFGEYASKTEDDTFVPTDKVTKKEIIKDASDNILGYAYTLSSVRNTGSNIDHHEDENWGLTLLVGVDTTNNIEGIYTLASDHTASFYGLHSTYFTALEGVAVSNYESVDTVSGASFSRGHILELLEALQGVLA